MAKQASVNNDVIRVRMSETTDFSKSKVKAMVHGQHKLFTESGRMLRSTQLGGKVAAIQPSVGSKTPN
jgi:hypothetical protein